jgi:hypothetical protein
MRSLSLWSLLSLLAAELSSGAPGRKPLRFSGNHSTADVEIATGLLEAFLHRKHLSRGEACAAHHFGGAAYAAEDVAFYFASAMVPGGEPESPDFVPAFVQFRRRLVGVGEQFNKGDAMDECGDLLRLKIPCLKAFAHIKNMSYITGHLIANGGDVIREIEDAVSAVKADEPRRFGHAIGLSLRKVLLSNTSNVTLPEGPPTLDELANMSVGVLQGFFGRGFELDVNYTGNISTDKKNINANGLEVHIDLHRCIARNIAYFRSVTRSLIEGIAAQDSGVMPSGAICLEAMAGLPDALRRCGLSKEDEEMLLGAALTASQHTSVGVGFPSRERGNDLLSGDRAAQLFEKAVHDWAAQDWYTLGQDLGKMMQGLMLSIMPNLYSIDGTGRLRHQLVGLSDGSHSGRVYRRLSSHLGLVAAVALTVTLAVAVRYRGQRAAVAEGDIEEAAKPILDIGSTATCLQPAD